MIAAALFLNTVPVSAEEKESAFRDYYNWELRPVTVKCEDAVADARSPLDVTHPVHGPWLTNPAYTSMTVNWVSCVPCGAAIEYRIKGTATWTRIWNVTYGQIDYSSDIHSFHLSGLKPASEYEYRFVTSFSQRNSVPVVGRETYSFRTLDPNRNSYKIFITADFHGGAR